MECEGVGFVSSFFFCYFGVSVRDGLGERIVRMSGGREIYCVNKAGIISLATRPY